MFVARALLLLSLDVIHVVTNSRVPPFKVVRVVVFFEFFEEFALVLDGARTVESTEFLHWPRARGVGAIHHAHSWQVLTWPDVVSVVHLRVCLHHLEQVTDAIVIALYIIEPIVVVDCVAPVLPIVRKLRRREAVNDINSDLGVIINDFVAPLDRTRDVDVPSGDTVDAIYQMAIKCPVLPFKREWNGR